MAETQSNPGHHSMDTLKSNSFSNGLQHFEKIETPFQEEDASPSRRNSGSYHYHDDADDDEDSLLCVSGSQLVRMGLTRTNCSELIVKFVNAGGKAIQEAGDSGILILPDVDFEGGYVLRTEESIIDGGDFASLYQSARVGNFCYRFENLSSGDYFVDLHFAEIVNTNGPKGMRVFDVFVQDEKVISEIDIYSIIGANRPLQLIDIRVTVGDSGVIRVRFEEVHGSPIVSGISIKEAPRQPDQAMVQQAAKLRDVCSNYKRHKKFCVAAIDELERKIKIMKQEHSHLSCKAQECANSIPDLNKMVSAGQGLVAQCNDLKLKYGEEQMKRKKLYNQIQETKGNIRVFCRCRPLNKEEVSAGCAYVVDFDAAKDGDLGILTGGSTKRIYKFDRVYTPKDGQDWT